MPSIRVRIVKFIRNFLEAVSIVEDWFHYPVSSNHLLAKIFHFCLVLLHRNSQLFAMPALVFSQPLKNSVIVKVLEH